MERLSKPLGLGVLSCDGISSANYGSELILHELLPFFGLAAFALLLPMTGVILLGVALVVLSYREVVTVYTRAGGSYVVARENFGPRVAQVAAVALMVDYVVTVAVQTAAGSAAILSTFPAQFTEGAWLVVAVFPVMVFLLMRLNRQYRTEAGVVEALSAGKPPDPPNYARRTVLVLVDDFDLAAIAALRYARSLRPTALRAVHFVIDQPRADHLLA